MAAGPLRVFFLWHFHQPWYADLAGGPTYLPWVRLHALKDYADLPAILSEEPRVPHACNLVPSLLDQIELLARGASDQFLDVARTPAAEWDGSTIAFILANFFSAHPRMIGALPRYAELKRRLDERPHDVMTTAVRRTFSREDLRDLVVLFHLAWCGQTLQKDRLVQRLRKRGHGFSEAEKIALLDRQREFLSGVIPAWRKALETGRIELTTSPYHHPILPLLVDSSAGREAVHDLPLPQQRFSRPEDARDQLQMGLATFERHFGFRPAGMWPPEGAVSERALALLAEAGVRWVASDEDVLLQSIGRMHTHAFGEGDKARAVFRPYRLSSGPSPVLFFRDRTLSDRIGFSYATWNADQAAGDFLARLHAIRNAAPEDDLVVPVILDGENAWETYPENGAPFLRALARTLAVNGIAVGKPSDILAAMEPRPLPRLVAGSWVDGNLRTWIGAPAKNRAWDLLAAAREAMAPDIASAPALSPPEILQGGAPHAAVAKAALFAAEASDWFWWFGDDHTSAHDAVFDALFRGHLVTACRALGRPVPPELEHPVERRMAPPALLPTSPLSPRIDGFTPDFFEWLGAGRHKPKPRGTMERATGPIREILFGGDAQGERIFLCLAPRTPPASASLGGLRLRILLPGPDGVAPNSHEVALTPGLSEQDSCTVGVERVAEVALPRPKTAGKSVAFRLLLLDGEGREVEAIPESDYIRFETLQVDWSA